MMPHCHSFSKLQSRAVEVLVLVLIGVDIIAYLQIIPKE